MQYKVDLHTHSIISYDGGITAEEYERVLESGKLDCIAITDHNETKFARKMYDRLGNKIIVGEEIRTKQGEIIGLFLKKTVQPFMSAQETISEIHAQGGVVYIPHPMETFRSGLKKELLEELNDQIDIIETFNARARWRGKPKESATFAKKYTIAEAASSDAHYFRGLGFSYTKLSDMPNNSTLAHLMKDGGLVTVHAPLYTLLTPFVNKVKNKVILSKQL